MLLNRKWYGGCSQQAGSVEMTMIKEGDIWKIDSLGMPKFDKFTLPAGNTDVTAE